MTLAIALLCPSVSQAQNSPWFRLGANAVPVYTFADPVPRGRSLGEIRLVQPAVMAHGGVLQNQLRLLTTVNFEGLTIPDGELTPGDWGEGFIDRRHPHTYVHEIMLSASQPLGQVMISAAFGKGFAPFGTDDPMSRPVLRYPVNHHLAQILERAVAIIGVRSGPFMAEAGFFNGDEPERPSQWPRVSRFGDSWSARVTVFPLTGLEFQASHARVHSPEHRPGSGTDQKKWSVSGRWSGTLGTSPLYAMAEWARTSEAAGFFVFRSVLAEGAWTLGRSRIHYRFERTERPEEERTADLFRSVRPHLENAILGTTRWSIHTAGYAFEPPALGAVKLAPFIELSYGRMADVGGGLFNLQAFYEKTWLWSMSAGARVTVGLPFHRMGRYGVAQDTAPSHAGAHHEQHD
ncbi:MAG TPA: hypothetical protein VHH32_10470 [Gemmatimonadales bacterium]|nr:hypothetical protein [Gemmatimonadales bacterium]